MKKESFSSIRIKNKIGRFLFEKRKINEKMLNKRAKGWFTFLLVLGVAVCTFSLFNIQLVKDNRDYFRSLSESEHLGDSPVSARRGTIYTSDMTELAKSIDCWDIYIVPKNFLERTEEEKEKVLSEFPEIIGLTRAEFEEYLENEESLGKCIVEKADYSTKEAVRKYIDDFYVLNENREKVNRIRGSFAIKDSVKRVYCAKSLASQILGFVSKDNIGIEGLEYYYEPELKGVDGRNITYNTPAGPISYISGEDPIEGTSLVLTIDESIQKYLEDSLKDCYQKSGCSSCTGIVMDTDTGAILGMANYPAYDPNNPRTVFDEKMNNKVKNADDSKKQQAESDALAIQWRNFAVSDTYEPGSVFKVITMAAGLEENAVSYEEPITCPGSVYVADREFGQNNVYYCYHHNAHGPQNITKGLMNSCNVFFIEVGQRLGQELFFKYFEAFGFTERTGIDLPGEATPSARYKGSGKGTYHPLEETSKVDLASCSFGQTFQVSAIQMLTAINTVANDGKLVKPYIVQKKLDSKNNVISVTQPQVKRQVISESTSELILASMEETSNGGTAKNSYVNGYHVAGKTGTSDKLVDGSKYVVSSFAGCAPSYDPQISIIIVVDEPANNAGGGDVAAPVAAEVIQKSLSHLNVERRYDDNSSYFKLSDFSGRNVEEVSEELKNKEVYVRVIGDGDKVVSQVPSNRSRIGKDGVVVLYTEASSDREKTTVPDFSDMTVSQAKYEALSMGLNINLSGNSENSSGLLAYKQNIKPDTKVEYGSEVTVYFKTSVGVGGD